MKLKKILTLSFLLLTISKTHAQSKDFQVTYDSFLRLNYTENQIAPNKEGLKVLDTISKLINEQKIPTNYYFCWQVEYLKCEKEKDSLIEYKRLDYIFNYFETKHNIKRELFKSEFYETAFLITLPQTLLL